MGMGLGVVRVNACVRLGEERGGVKYRMGHGRTLRNRILIEWRFGGADSPGFRGTAVIGRAYATCGGTSLWRQSGRPAASSVVGGQ